MTSSSVVITPTQPVPGELVTMTINGIGGFQRATLKVPVDFTSASLSVPAGPAPLARPASRGARRARPATHRRSVLPIDDGVPEGSVLLGRAGMFF